MSGAQEGLLGAWAGHLYALATTGDGRVRTFDTVTGRLRSRLSSTSDAGPVSGKAGAGGLANGHLADSLQCLAWLEAEPSASAAARSGTPATTSALAAGTAAGAVRAYDSATGAVLWQADGCNEGGVLCLAHARGQGLFCSGHDGQVACLDPGSGALRRRFRGSKHAITAAAAAADGSKLLLGGSTLVLWDLEEDARTAKFAGHTTPVRAMAFAPSGRHAVSAAPSERSVAVWNTSGSKKAKKLGGVAVASLPLDDPAASLATCPAPGAGEDAFYAAAVTDAGEAFVWLCVPEGEAAVVATLAARVRVGAEKVAPGTGGMHSGDAVFAADLEPSDNGTTLVVVRGSSARPTFERVSVAAPQQQQQQKQQQQQQQQGQRLICLEPIVGGALMRGDGDSKQPPTPPQQRGRAGGASDDVDMLGPENDGVLVRPRVAAAAAGGKKRAQPEEEEEALLASGGSAAAAAAAGASDDDEADAAGEATLGERVAALEREAAGASGPEEDADAAAAAAAGAALLADGPVKADSLAVLLQQALRSSDRALLERCLSLSADPRVVRNSVRRLLPIDAAALLRACVERLQSRPVRGQQLAGWIRAVLHHHAAYLMAAPGAAPVLTALYQTIEARLAMQRTLQSLSGRLDLLLAQSAPQQAGDDDSGAPVPAAVYEEGSSDAEGDGAEVEVEDAFAPREAGSDSDEFEDDDGEGSEDGEGMEEDEEEGEDDD
ncbi:hypothetical protein Rsub_00628 [Raphidocelis subcapitata]|uniref:Small-subunit processome Utp12 domain-containing protein n=1 Tax=Raphidocelis subcapitata TaxID=307507 RepID=A0A2V0NKP7_9CHLO|nr:hypothetical protein Rsub_00628 [Raphidocelis subcapitata]|eukprot:GBF87916.1 hypothetical protein Rsub_00628 [Raphidocelis subcapitata]